MQSSRWWHAAKSWPVVVVAALSLVAFSELVWRRWRASTVPLTAETAADRSLPAVKPPPPAGDYLGSEACAKCHADIYETYTKHPMHLSAGWVLGEHDVEAYDEAAEFQPHRNRRYRVERTDDGVLHHELIFDTQGDLIDDVAPPCACSSARARVAGRTASSAAIACTSRRSPGFPPMEGVGTCRRAFSRDAARVSNA